MNGGLQPVPQSPVVIRSNQRQLRLPFRFLSRSSASFEVVVLVLKDPVAIH